MQTHLSPSNTSSLGTLDKLEAMGTDMREWVQLIRDGERIEKEKQAQLEIEQKRLKESEALEHQIKKKQERIPFRQLHQDPDRHLPPMERIHKTIGAKGLKSTNVHYPQRTADVDWPETDLQRHHRPAVDEETGAGQVCLLEHLLQLPRRLLWRPSERRRHSDARQRDSDRRPLRRRRVRR